MARKKRPYVPKIVGCQQCLLRRIHCTREEPACQKCVKAGLECSGLNYRVEKLGLKPLPPRSTKQPRENDNSVNSGQGSGIEIRVIQSPLANQGQPDDQRIPPSQSTVRVKYRVKVRNLSNLVLVLTPVYCPVFQ
ncbi:uncharacterized protein BKA55DRAFT_682237 [Fusarium redolens]|uniref:Zn(2)-C6 fungal-type domain-containing protein n=1 Tax=Fusarium redolens TaxID=48865 RepID=A0A9P9KV78_FUSRE|nr:uncharacterized protein BKA55DRAFT_682237 [Fusarium redolens]KAH7269146.1 hypothetical protein BKA55DRAFT_682237 [Fusarium redolens]